MEMEELAKVVNITLLRKAVTALANFKVSFGVRVLLQYSREDLVQGRSKKDRL